MTKIKKAATWVDDRTLAQRGADAQDGSFSQETSKADPGERGGSPNGRTSPPTRSGTSYGKRELGLERASH